MSSCGESGDVTGLETPSRAAKAESVRASLIIPTRGQAATVRRALESLAASGLPRSDLEVLVVQNGDGAPLTLEGAPDWPFCLRVLHLAQPSAALARNHGALVAAGPVLVFMDDDIIPRPGTLARLLCVAEAEPSAVVLGNLVTGVDGRPSQFTARLVAREAESSSIERQNAVDGMVDVPFTHCMTGLMAIQRDVFADIGMFQDPGSGWHFWDDVEFGNRAVRAGHPVVRHVEAIAEHMDAAATSLQLFCARWWRASCAAATLFQQFPELQPVIAMYRDMGPALWGAESFTLSVRKSLRRLSATPPGMTALWLATVLAERMVPLPAVLDPLYRWTVGAYTCRGFRSGLRAASVVGPEMTGHGPPAGVNRPA